MEVRKVVLKEEGTFRYSHKGRTGLVYIPAKIVTDSQFPLKEGKVGIEVQGDKVIVSQQS